MTVTARVVVLMTPAEKAALDTKAREAGHISAAELVRRAVSAYNLGTEGEAEELRQLLAAFQTIRAETLRQLDRTDRKLDATLASLAQARQRP